MIEKYIPVTLRKRVDSDPVFLDLLQDLLLQLGYLFLAQAIRLGDDGNDADFVRQLLHDLDIEGLQTVAVGVDEVETAVDAIIDDVFTV